MLPIRDSWRGMSRVMPRGRLPARAQRAGVSIARWRGAAGRSRKPGRSLAGGIRGANEHKRTSESALIDLHRLNHLPRFARKHFLHLLVLLVLSAASGAGDTGAAVLESTRAPRDAALQTDPASAFWRSAG